MRERGIGETKFGVHMHPAADMAIGSVFVLSLKEYALLQESLVRFQGKHRHGHRWLMYGQCYRWLGGGHLWGVCNGRSKNVVSCLHHCGEVLGTCRIFLNDDPGQGAGECLEDVVLF